jgi:hypothetical protein
MLKNLLKVLNGTHSSFCRTRPPFKFVISKNLAGFPQIENSENHKKKDNKKCPAFPQGIAYVAQE